MKEIRSIVSIHNKAIGFLLALLVVSNLAEGGLRTPGKYCGVAIFDRWDGCTLYSGIYVMYVSEKVKEGLRPHTGKAVQINATEVLQPINPGDGLIQKLEYLGAAPKSEQLPKLVLKTTPAFKDGEPPAVLIELTNDGREAVTVYASELAPTLLAPQKLSQPDLSFSPSDGPSYAIVTRNSFAISDAPRWNGTGYFKEAKFSWTVGQKNELHGSPPIEPGASITLKMKFENLPEGEYDFLCGYGGGTHDSACLASNLTAFDVLSDGTGKVVKVKRQ
jgi:hypothetical protein